MLPLVSTTQVNAGPKIARPRSKLETKSPKRTESYKKWKSTITTSHQFFFLSVAGFDAEVLLPLSCFFLDAKSIIISMGRPTP